MSGGAGPGSPVPTLILGGFLITPEAYAPMAAAISERSGQPVEVVPVTRGEWLLTSWTRGWRLLLDRSQTLLERLASRSPSGRVNLVGHSSGGVMLRLLLGDQPFAGRVYAARARVRTLLTLGSPHSAIRGTALRRLVDQRYPGAYYAGSVRYVSVAGAIEPAQLRPRARRLAPRSYSAICGDPHSRGDGLVPLGSALLAGSEQRILEGVGHGGWFAKSWYGSPEVLPAWLGLLDADRRDPVPDPGGRDGPLA